jgi:hypothetical protein
MNSLLKSLPKFLPQVYAYVDQHEAIILAEGQPLTDAEQADARKAGVQFPEKIRRLGVLNLPEPDSEELMFVARRSGLFQLNSCGLALGYGIYLRQDVWESRAVLIHECVHVGQYERLGKNRFIDIYLRECLDPGYPFGALEQEAILVSRDICK